MTDEPRQSNFFLLPSRSKINFAAVPMFILTNWENIEIVTENKGDFAPFINTFEYRTHSALLIKYCKSRLCNTIINSQILRLWLTVCNAHCMINKYEDVDG